MLDRIALFAGVILPKASDCVRFVYLPGINKW
jgi:hypothetical protein